MAHDIFFMDRVHRAGFSDPVRSSRQRSRVKVPLRFGGLVLQTHGPARTLDKRFTQRCLVRQAARARASGSSSLHPVLVARMILEILDLPFVDSAVACEAVAIHALTTQERSSERECHEGVVGRHAVHRRADPVPSLA